MRHARTSTILALALLSGACVSKKTHQSLQAQLAQCQGDLTKSQDNAADYVRQFDKERERWNAIEARYSQVIPDAVRTFEEERSKIISVVPDQVREQVGKRLDTYFVRVAKEFESLNLRIDGLQAQLVDANRSLESLNQATQSVDTHVQEARAAADTHATGDAARLRSQLDEQRKLAAAIVSEVAEWDRDHVNCAPCSGQLRLKRDGKALVAEFHGKLVERLAALQAAGSSTGM